MSPSEIYKQRQEDKKLRAAYREAGRNLIFEQKQVNITVSDHSNLQVMDDGAFVEVTVWIPKELLK